MRLIVSLDVELRILKKRVYVTATLLGMGASLLIVLVGSTMGLREVGFRLLFTSLVLLCVAEVTVYVAINSIMKRQGVVSEISFSNSEDTETSNRRVKLQKALVYISPILTVAFGFIVSWNLSYTAFIVSPLYLLCLNNAGSLLEKKLVVKDGNVYVMSNKAKKLVKIAWWSDQGDTIRLTTTDSEEVYVNAHPREELMILLLSNNIRIQN